MSKELKSTLASWGRSFMAACLAQWLALGGSAFDSDANTFKSVVAAGLAAILPVVIRWLNPNDKAFGYKGEEEDANS
jgi:hypothetical protein